MKKIRHFFAFPQSPCKLTLMFSLPFIAILISVLAALVLWERRNHERELVAQLREIARAYFEQIVITRLWNAQHGGVYVEVTKDAQPNPYLKDDPERDIVTAGGRKYTKINPAYMTRQLSELAYQKGRYKFRITSLQPLNPQNMPDDWETRQLHLFETSKKNEAYEIVNELNKERFRYMAPLIAETACLQCHAKQGYKEGDIRGGISIDIPMELPRSILKAEERRDIIAVSIIVLASTFFVIAMIWFLSKRVVRDMEKEIEHERLKSAIHFAGAAAHELRQPLTIIIGFSELLKDKISKDESAQKDMDIIIQQCFRMNELIKKMVNITQYKTRIYSDDTEIFDLEIESGEITHKDN